MSTFDMQLFPKGCTLTAVPRIDWSLTAHSAQQGAISCLKNL